MISFIKGRLEAVSPDSVTVDVHGIGMEALVPLTVAAGMPAIGEEVKLYTYLHVREDLMQLYGFLTKDELSFFKLLITVNGIGPKAALAILSSMPTDMLTFAILSEDVKTLSKAQGIGQKTAKKLVLELKEKVGVLSETKILMNAGKVQGADVDSGENEVKNEAVEVLNALGYSGTEAMKAVGTIEIGDFMTSEDVVKLALKLLV